MLNNSTENPVYSCYPAKDSKYYLFFTHIWNILDTTIYSILPIFVMVVCSVIIWVELREQTKQFSANVGITNQAIMKKKIRKNRHLLFMLTATNAYFVICSFPYFFTFNNLTSKKFDSNFTQVLVHILSYSNNSVNFIFYGLFSQKYREVLKDLFRR